MVEFSKYHVAGNNILVFDCREQECLTQSFFYRRLARSSYGLNYDQAMLILNPKEKQFSDQKNKPAKTSDDFSQVSASFDIYNQDGTHANMCGNGLACIGDYIRKKDDYSECTLRNTKCEVYIDANNEYEIVVKLGQPNFKPEELPYTGQHDNGVGALKLPSGETIKFYLVDMGNPHAVIFLDQEQGYLLEQINLIGASLNKNPDFPQGVNVSLVQPKTADTAAVRIYERGVGETLSCGSAACAIASISQRWFGNSAKLDLQFKGGVLGAKWNEQDNATYLYACPELVLEGRLYPSHFQQSPLELIEK